MAITLTIDSTDRTSNVISTTISKRDNLNERVDTLSFSMRTYGTAKTFVPEPNKEVVLMDGSSKLFGGVIVSVEQKVERKVVIYSVTCKDYSQYLDRKLVTERYENKTVAYIINDLITTYGDLESFTTNNVVGTLTIDSIAFNRITLSECLKKLSKLTNYSWYVDYDKDIHFFPKSTEVAPFSLTDNGGNHIYDSLVISEDLSQIRNSILVEGGTKEGSERTTTHEADGTNDTYDTIFKFSGEPVVEVDDVVQTVGIENLQEDADFECMWNFNEKYIRFTAGNIPTAASVIEITGTPLLPIIVRVPSAVSIAEYGLYEHAIKDKSIISNEQAIERAKAELGAYGATVEEGGFSTYRSGLRSGQVLTINSTARGKSLDVLIQSVTMKYRDHEGLKPVYSVSFATLRTMGIIDWMLAQLDNEELSEGESETLLNYIQGDETVNITDTISTPETTSPPYKYSNDAGTTPNKGRYSYATFS